MRGAVVSLKHAADLLREEPILGQDPELLETLAVVIGSIRNAVEQLMEPLKRVLKPS